VCSDLGPESALRPVTAFFDKALAAARLCGVTRLADITGLDRLGLPVWQTVRPAGRSLSVHQGKGPAPAAAKLGALCEAIESHCAENAPADGPLCRFADLPRRERAADVGDYCRDRNALPESADPILWCSAADLATGKPIHLPHHQVSLDYTMGLPSHFERTSGGLGAGAAEADALLIALLEVIERDGVGEWQRRDPARRAAASLDLGTIPFGWFQSWRNRFASLDVELQAWRVPSLVGVPTFMCVIGGAEEFGPAYRRFSGTAAHGDPELALFKALAEAIQSRLTLIAGVRDDILPSHYARPQPKPAECDLSPGRLAWDGIEPIACGVEMIAERLAALGYRQIAVKRLDDGLEGVAVTKAFVPGLGSLTRARRAPL
jgi:ribosomal protein S12 methylthiotransferase accessory factor